MSIIWSKCQWLHVLHNDNSLHPYTRTTPSPLCESAPSNRSRQPEGDAVYCEHGVYCTSCQRADREAIIDATVSEYTDYQVGISAFFHDRIIAIVEHDGEERPNMADCPT